MVGSSSTKVVNIYKLKELLLSGIIKLDADYQRDIVWNSTKMSLLIDSILKKYYISPLLFAIRIDEEGRQSMVCIDGKQRLTSILRFTQNRIPHLDESSGVVEEVYFEKSGQQAHQRKHAHPRFLSEEEKHDFYDTEVTLVEFNDLDEDDELEIFSRIQMGVSITASEKLVATSSQVSKLSRAYISSHQKLVSTLHQLNLAPFKCLAQLHHCLYETNTKQSFVSTPMNLVKFLNQKAPLPPSFRRTSRHILDLLNQLCKDKKGIAAFFQVIKKGDRVSKKPIKAIEFLVFGVFIGRSSRRVTVAELIDDLIDLRSRFDAYRGALLSGNPCWLVGMDWIEKRLDGKPHTLRTIASSSSSTTITRSTRNTRLRTRHSSQATLPSSPSPSFQPPMARRGRRPWKARG
ncbi:hypothetical protein BC941DRAFT_435541 [Chlamydoabsidia padenii]|nr:hypothetical protein BC941DRAFT_435541 [Chlamydoabsidia padenii]